MSRKHSDPRVTEIDDFIRKKLIKLLEEDQKNWYVSSEGDLQSAVYYHLRNFLKKSNKIARRWFVQNKLTTESKSLIYPDIVISRLREQGKLKPYFAIELKITKRFERSVLKKDIKKLEKLVSRKNRFKQGFVIYVCRDEKYVADQWHEMIAREVYIDPSTGDDIGWIVTPKYQAKITPILINAFAEKWHVKNLADFKRRHKELRKYSG